MHLKGTGWNAELLSSAPGILPPFVVRIERGRPSVPDWVTLDLGIGAVGGSIITGAVAVYVDYRKRRDERKNRFLDKKQQAYKQYSVYVSLYFDELMLFAEIWPILSQLERGTATDEDVEEFRQARAKGDANLEKLHEPIQSALTDIGILAPKHLHHAANEVFEVTLKLIEHLNNNEGNENIDAEPFQSEFSKLMREFQIAARVDLGIRE
jgi:hypothetical protein